MSEPAKALRLVDENGEINECESCRMLADQIAGLQKALGDQARLISNLKRNRELEARAHELWPLYRKLGKLYNAESKRKCKFGRARFENALPHLVQYDERQLVCGILGIVHHPEVVKGRTFDSWETLWRNEGSIEKYSRRGWGIWNARQTVC